MPEDRNRFEKTTCRHPFCPATDHASQPGEYRVSVERASHFEDISPFSQRIPLRPQHPWSGKLKFGGRACEKRGLGRNVESWWCLVCAENIWLELDGFILPSSIGPRRLEPELYELLGDLQPERRAAGPTDRLYHLSAPQIYTLEKWRAVGLHKAVENYGIDPGPEAVSGAEPDTLYPNSGVRDLDSVDDITGRPIFVEVHDVAEKRLSEVMRMVDEKIESQRQLLLASDPTTRPSTSAPLLGGDSPQTPQNGLVVRLPISHRMAKFLLERSKAQVSVEVEENSRPPHSDRLTIDPPVKKRAANTVTDEVVPSSKKRRPEHREAALMNTSEGTVVKPTRTPSSD